MLIIGEHDKTLRDLRNSKESRQLSAVWMESWSVVWKISETGVYILHISALKVWVTAMSISHSSPSPHFLHRHPSPTDWSHHCL